MTAVTLVYALSLAAYLSLAVRVLRRTPRTPLNWSCAAVLIALAFWSVEDIVHGMPSAPKSLAWVFGYIGSVGWVGFASIHLVFALVLTRRLKLLRSWPVWLALAVPPAAFIYVQIAGHLTGHSALTGDYVLTGYGWQTVWSNTPWVPSYYAYYTLYTLAALYLIFRLRRSARTYRERKQAGLILSTGVITLVLGTVTDVVLPQFSYFGLPNLAGALCLIWAGGLYFAVTRYGLMSVTAQGAAREIIATMADALLLLTPEGSIAIANHGASDLLGRDDLELRGQQADQFFAPPDEFRQALARVGEEVSLTALELECRDRNGRIVPVSVSGRLMRDKAGETVGSVWVLRDITARREAEQRQALLLRQVEAANQDLADFAHVVAHDLKNPLCAVLGFAGPLTAAHVRLSDKDVSESLQGISHGARKMSGIIDELLLLAEVREADVEKQPVEMAAVVSGAMQRLSYMTAEYVPEITKPDAWPVALGYGPWIEEVWANYLSNAMKYGGKPPRLELGADTTDDNVRFWVRDNGPGLTPEQQARLFLPFTRLHQARTTGQGLGLSIVRRIMEKLGGEAWVESEPGKGSRFGFTLPRAKSEYPAPPGRNTTTAP
jgi:PAS domain S-box-containing protein